MISYDKLWHRLIDVGLNKTELCTKTGISSSTMAKMSKNEAVSLNVLERVCKELKCNIGDIADFHWDQE